MNKEIEFWVATSAIPGVGTATFNYLLKKFKRLQKFWEAPDSEIQKLKLDSKTRESIIKFRNEVRPRLYLETVYERGIKVVSVVDREYPANLRQISDAPPVLYFRGTLLPQDDLAIAVVGARFATSYGRQVTEQLVGSLVMSRLVIVSGLARGIDSFAHRAALEAGGRTIAGLGWGVDTIYPPENKKLAEDIVKNGALVSEFPLGFPSVPSNFPARNRIISGLSLEVFAVAGPIVSKMSRGANNLIKEGVHPATEASDILQILEIERKAQQQTRSKKLETSKMGKDQKKILDLLDGSSKHIDVIAREVGLPIEKVSSALSLMELSGFIKNYGSGVWGV